MSKYNNNRFSALAEYDEIENIENSEYDGMPYLIPIEDEVLEDDVAVKTILNEIDSKGPYSDDTIDYLLEAKIPTEVDLGAISLSEKENAEELRNFINNFNKNPEAKQIIIPIRTQDGRFTALSLTKNNDGTPPSAIYIDLRGTGQTYSPSLLQSGINWMFDAKDATPKTTEIGSLPLHIRNILITTSKIAPKDITFTTNKIQQPTDNIGEPFLVQILKNLATGQMTVTNNSLHEKGRDLGNFSPEMSRKAEKISRLKDAKQLVADHPELSSRRLGKSSERIIENHQGASITSVMSAAVAATLLASESGSKYLRGSGSESNTVSLNLHGGKNIKPLAPPPRPASFSPSFEPTLPPSFQPYLQPTTQPTSQPKSQPSSQPIGKPSLYPTKIPSIKPSLQPSTQPSNKPSNNPLSDPSSQPSNKPSNNPLSDPSSQPSKKPSVKPSSQPSSNPSAKKVISKPTPGPSLIISYKPSIQRSDEPSTQITSKPTPAPYVIQSSIPSIQRSDKPSAEPSIQRSDKPSAEPSNTASSSPSQAINPIPTNTTEVTKFLSQPVELAISGVSGAFVGTTSTTALLEPLSIAAINTATNVFGAATALGTVIVSGVATTIVGGGLGYAAGAVMDYLNTPKNPDNTQTLTFQPTSSPTSQPISQLQNLTNTNSSEPENGNTLHQLSEATSRDDKKITTGANESNWKQELGLDGLLIGGGMYFGGKALRHAATAESNISSFVALLLATNINNYDISEIDKSLKYMSDFYLAHSSDTILFQNTLNDSLAAIFADTDAARNEIKTISKKLLGKHGGGNIAPLTLEILRQDVAGIKNSHGIREEFNGILPINDRNQPRLDQINTRELSIKINNYLTKSQKEIPLGNIPIIPEYAPEHEVLALANKVLNLDKEPSHNPSIIEGYGKRLSQLSNLVSGGRNGGDG